MKKIAIETTCKKMLADVHTPVGIYLRLRDRFRDTVMLESTDSHVTDNSWTFIGVQAIGGIEVKDLRSIEYKYPGQPPEKKLISKDLTVAAEIGIYLNKYQVSGDNKIKAAQSLFGYTSFDAVQFFEDIDLSRPQASPGEKHLDAPMPLIRYRLYQYVIAINHFKDELYICENKIAGLESESAGVESLIRSKDVPVFPFKTKGGETSNMTDDNYISMVRKGIGSCLRGDTFQIVLSRRFQQSFTGDEFNVYRALRSINPSPYLFFFDYGDYKLMGSSPESQLIVNNGKAVVHPIAGTFRRTGDDAKDETLAEQLLADPKENAEHVMLVDLARNDLSRHAENVIVSSYRKVHYYSHVIHLVSEVTGKVKPGAQPFEILADTFPAGTLSGAPKFKAMQLINEYEPTARGYYGGCIGLVGLDGSFNNAIMIRTFLSMNNTLFYQAGAGIVAGSIPESELQEVNNKLNALKNAIAMAEEISD
ncbi:MAG: anthranilate synthase component I family protein [Ferruginibacter sp.]|nr:anthranilate synthase component I family protein [Chitinophagaceae bacterium]